MKKYLQLAGLILIFLISACEKEEIGHASNDYSCFLYQILYDSVLFYEYTYNDSKQILEEKSKLHYTKHNYRNKRLVSSDYYVDRGMFSSCSHLSDSAFNRKEWVDPSNTEVFSTKYYNYDDKDRIINYSDGRTIIENTYDNKNRIVRQAYLYQEEISGYRDYIYDNNNNLKKELHYWILNSGEAELQTTTDYEYDKMNNPFRAFGSSMIPGERTNTNNIIKKTYTIQYEVDFSIDQVQTTENTYVYNTQGFPISKNNSEFYKYY